MAGDEFFGTHGTGAPGGSVAPPVIGAEFVADESEPILVFLPSERLNTGDEYATIEFRRIADGKLAVLAYTSLEKLVECCGQYQPWVQLPGDRIESIVAESGAEVVLWDAALPAEQRRDEKREM